MNRAALTLRGHKISAELILYVVLALGILAYLKQTYDYRRALEVVAYIPGSDRLSTARATAFEIPQRHLGRFGEHFVSNYEAFLPATVEAQMGYCKTLMSQRALSQDPSALADIVSYSRTGQITSLVQIVPGTTEVIEHRNRWEVNIQLIKQEYTRGRLFRSMMMECRLIIVPGVVSSVTPDGLLVDQYTHTATPLSGQQETQ